MERKARPSLRRDSGMNFPPTTYPENAPHSEPIFWDAVSVGRPLGKRVPPCVDAAHGRLKFDKHRIRFESKVCAENPRICFANPHRLRPPAGVLARGLKTLARFLYARALRRVRFSAGGGIRWCGGIVGRNAVGSTSVLGWDFARRIRVFASQIRTGFGRLPASSPAG